MSGLLEHPAGATPRDDEYEPDLIPTWVATRGDLNAAEQENILAAMHWAFVERRSWKVGEIDERMIRELHRRMFADVWRWAGEYRRTQTNIGVRAYAIPIEIRNLLADVAAQLSARDSDWGVDEIAVRFHHRLVLIHPFPNGNGRHARLAADLIAAASGSSRFTWGSGADLQSTGRARDAYLSALRAADRGEIGQLLAFARS